MKLPVITDEDRKRHPFLREDEDILVIMILNSLTNGDIVSLYQLQDVAPVYIEMVNLLKSNGFYKTYGLGTKLYIINQALEVAVKRNLLKENQQLSYWINPTSWQDKG
jgi:hypothetical protein